MKSGQPPLTLTPIRHVADLVGLHWHTVKTIDKQRLQRDLPAPDPTRLRRLMMDEFALHKGHRYATVIACADTQQVVWIGEGRSREAIRPFFEWLCVTLEQFIEEVDDYIQWHNRKRIKLSLGDKSPIEYRAGLGLAA